MSNYKQSSIEWLISQLKISTYWNNLISELELMECGEIDILEQAKAMHKEEILSFESLLDEHEINALNNNTMLLTREEFYNETFGGNNEQ